MKREKEKVRISNELARLVLNFHPMFKNLQRLSPMNIIPGLENTHTHTHMHTHTHTHTHNTPSLPHHLLQIHKISWLCEMNEEGTFFSPCLTKLGILQNWCLCCQDKAVQQKCKDLSMSFAILFILQRLFYLVFKGHPGILNFSQLFQECGMGKTLTGCMKTIQKKKTDYIPLQDSQIPANQVSCDARTTPKILK